MRRKDFDYKNINETNIFLDAMNDGVLATVTTSGLPSVRPMNFVKVDNIIYFHGARSGEKIEGLSNQASFNVYKPLSLIPSYWSEEKNACPATALFQSVVIKGVLQLVENLEQKAIALQKLMEKLQPEKKYLPLDSNLSFYEKSIERVCVFELPMEEISYKLKLGQNWDLDKRNKIHKLLIERGNSIDLETAKLMDKFGILAN